MDENEVRQIVQEEIEKAAQQAQYGVSRVPVHTHNNIDSPNLNQPSITGFTALDGIAGGVANPDLLNGQALVFGDRVVGSKPNISYTNIYNYALPVVYGYGTTSAGLTMTGSPVAGATTATLTGAFGDPTQFTAVQFINGEIRIAKLTSASTAVVWTGPLQFNSGGTALAVINNARFHGGTAPSGTALIFRNDDDGVLQLWTRTQPDVFIESWASVDLTLSIVD